MLVQVPGTLGPGEAAPTVSRLTKLQPERESRFGVKVKVKVVMMMSDSIVEGCYDSQSHALRQKCRPPGQLTPRGFHRCSAFGTARVLRPRARADLHRYLHMRSVGDFLSEGG